MNRIGRLVRCVGAHWPRENPSKLRDEDDDQNLSYRVCGITRQHAIADLARAASGPDRRRRRRGDKHYSSGANDHERNSCRLGASPLASIGAAA